MGEKGESVSLRPLSSLLALLGVRWVSARADTRPMPGKWTGTFVQPPLVAVAYTSAHVLIVQTFHQYDPTHYTREEHDLGLGSGTLRVWSERMCEVAIKRLSVSTDAPGAGMPAADPVLARKYPRLVEHLTSLTYDDGEARQTATMLLFTQDGEWRLCLHDRDAEAHLWASGPSLEKTLANLEERLCEDDPGWRAKRGDGKTGKRKKGV